MEIPCRRNGREEASHNLEGEKQDKDMLLEEEEKHSVSSASTHLPNL